MVTQMFTSENLIKKGVQIYYQTAVKTHFMQNVTNNSSRSQSL